MVQNTETLFRGIDRKEYDMNELEKAHIAGFFDGSGKITVHIDKDSSYKLGYRVRPMVQVSMPETDDVMMGMLDEFAEEHGVAYAPIEKEKSLIFQITNLESMRRFLEEIGPHLVARYEEAVLMVEEVVPTLEADKHNTKEGFYELVGVADRLRAVGRRGSDAKYTQEFFQDEWDLGAEA